MNPFLCAYTLRRKPGTLGTGTWCQINPRGGRFPLTVAASGFSALFWGLSVCLQSPLPFSTNRASRCRVQTQRQALHEWEDVAVFSGYARHQVLTGQ